MIYTLKETAQILKVSVMTIKRWHKIGHIKCIRINPRGDRRVSQEEIDRILNN